MPTKHPRFVDSCISAVPVGIIAYPVSVGKQITDKSKKIHNYLNKKGVGLPRLFAVFHNMLQDNRRAVHLTGIVEGGKAKAYSASFHCSCRLMG